MNCKKISSEEYEKNPVPIQYVGYYVLHVKELDLPHPECFFAEDEKADNEARSKT